MDISLLNNFEPIRQLNLEHRNEIAASCSVDTIEQGQDVVQMLNTLGKSVYLSRGELRIIYAYGSEETIVASSPLAKYPVIGCSKMVKKAIALNSVEMISVDRDTVDLMMTWEQAANVSEPDTLEDELWAARSRHMNAVDAKLGAIGTFGAKRMQGGAFSRLPSANIDELFRRMQSVGVSAGQVVINQGEEGDYFYLIESGSAVVTQTSRLDKPVKVLARLGEGDAFGEEAPVSDNRRNATVTMQTDGVLLRLGKQDFVELMKEPLLTVVNRQEAQKKVVQGAMWLDVRTPSESDFDRLPNSINVPLSEIRGELASLDKSKAYVVYCQSGRRSAAAAFIMTQHGFDVSMLQGGLMGESAT